MRYWPYLARRKIFEGPLCVHIPAMVRACCLEQVCAPGLPDLTLIDLPGIVRTATKGQRATVMAEVNALIQRWEGGTSHARRAYVAVLWSLQVYCVVGRPVSATIICGHVCVWLAIG